MIYATLAAQGVQAIGSFFGEDTASYNAAYAAAARRTAIAEAKHTAELNISAIQQDKITSNSNISMKQMQAEAATKVNAATAGVEGGSVNSVLYDTERNKAFALNAMNAQAEQAQNQQVAQIGSQQSALLSVTEPQSSLANDITGNLMDAFSSFEMKDLDIAEALLYSKDEDIFGLDFNGSNP